MAHASKGLKRLTNEELLDKHRAMLAEEEAAGKAEIWFISQVVEGKPETARVVYLLTFGPAHCQLMIGQLGLRMPNASMQMSVVDYVPKDEHFGVSLTRQEVRDVEAVAIPKARAGIPKIYWATLDN